MNTPLQDGDYKVINGVATPAKKTKAGRLIMKTIVWLFAIYLVLATANCVVQEGVKIHDAIVTVV